MPELKTAVPISATVTRTVVSSHNIASAVECTLIVVKIASCSNEVVRRYDKKRSHPRHTSIIIGTF